MGRKFCGRDQKYLWYIVTVNIRLLIAKLRLLNCQEMSDSFDPYLKWLGIRRDKATVDHYRLLGLELFESDTDVIANAAERQIRHVEALAVNENESVGKQILIELRAARDCLLNPVNRAAYEKELGKDSSKPTPREAPNLFEDELPSIGIKTTPEHESATDSVPTVRAPVIQAGRRKRQKRNNNFDIAGWLLGAIGAVAFAYVLLNTDLIEQIKGAKHETNVAEPSAESGSKIERTLAKPQQPQRRNASSEPVESRKPALDRSIRSSSNQRKPSNKSRQRNLPELVNTNAPRELKAIVSRVGVAVPSSDKVKQARAELKTSYRAQYASATDAARRELALSLFHKSADEPRSEMAYAMLMSCSELAAELGDVSLVVKASDVLNRQFDIDYWSEISPMVSMALNPKHNFELIAADLESLLQRARRQEAYDFCTKTAHSAARVVKKSGDLKQVEMLNNFAMDMKSLSALKRQYDKLAASKESSQSKGEKLTIGKYLCYGKSDWQSGLKYLEDGSDSMLAAMAQTDLQSNDNDRHTVIERWLKLSTEPKYRGLDRRCFLERVGVLLDQAKGMPNQRQIGNAVRENTQVVKNFIDDSLARTRNVAFGFIQLGNNKVGPIHLERGGKLSIGAGKTRRALNVSKKGLTYSASLPSRRLKFEIRFMDNGWAEMRVRDTTLNRFTIWYGK